jgi:hypothetical protein
MLAAFTGVGAVIAMSTLTAVCAGPSDIAVRATTGGQLLNATTTSTTPGPVTRAPSFASPTVLAPPHWGQPVEP